MFSLIKCFVPYQFFPRGNPFRADGSTRKSQQKVKQRFNVMLGFGGASNMGEDQASRRLDVDEHGISQGDNLWTGPSTDSFPSIDSSRKGDHLSTNVWQLCKWHFVYRSETIETFNVNGAIKSTKS